jgi:hypothetical protein
MRYAQMSLDTKRAEIKKLQDRARQHEEALKRSEVRGALRASGLSRRAHAQQQHSGATQAQCAGSSGVLASKRTCMHVKHTLHENGGRPCSHAGYA